MKPDILDVASELSQHYIDDAVAAASRKARPEQVQNADGSWPHPDCVECDNEIPEGRLLATGKIRCVFCQAKIEARRGGR